MKFKAGFGKHETTCFIPGIGMMGYGQPHNTVKEVATPLFARAMILQDHQNKTLIMVHLEQAFVSLAIKEEILRRLQTKWPEINSANLMITAQHTHSAPGGYSHYPFYNFTIPDFQLKVFNTVCDGILMAIEVAKNNIESVTLHWGKHTISEDKEIAFNRSMKAYLNNPEAKSIKEDEWHLGINRTMEGLRVVNSDGKEKAFFNWFGVHATNVSSFNHRIHHDNKGVAAALYEKNHPGSMAFFLQEAAGDVSPNFIWDKSLGRMRGKFKDQYESAAYNGELQFRESEQIEFNQEITGELSCVHQFMDMSSDVAPPAHGVAFFEGTKEGPGISPILGNILRGLSRAVKQKQLFNHPDLHSSFYEKHWPKDILLDHRSGSFIGIPLKVWKKLPLIPEKTIEAFRITAKKEAINTLPWVPSILPFQLIVLGPVLIVAVPGEITTMAAQKLKEAIINELTVSGIKHVIISSYANAYMGYITTPYEYVTQSYEAGHTVYGRETLSGIIKGFTDLVKALNGKEVLSSKIEQPFHFPADELARRTSP